MMRQARAPHDEIVSWDMGHLTHQRQATYGQVTSWQAHGETANHSEARVRDAAHGRDVDRCTRSPLEVHGTDFHRGNGHFLSEKVTNKT